LKKENSEYILAAENITKRYGSAEVLKNMCFRLKRGEVHCLLGANGAGKSTLLKLLNGVLTDYEGQLFIDGKKATLSGPRDAAKKGISMVHQELSVLPNISVAENIFLNRLPRTPLGLIKWNELYKESAKVLASIGMDIDPRTPLKNLTVADMQMVEIARIISMDAPIILLDEPTSALSEAEIQRLLKLILQFKEEGRSIVFITHKLDEILAVSDRITVMRDGCLVDTIEVTDRSFEAQGALVGMMIGEEKGDMQEMFPAKGSTFGETILQVDGLGREGVFHDINFHVQKGEVVVFTGLKGAKRTEVMRCIFGADNATSGTIKVKGKEVQIAKVSDAIANGIAMVTEDRKEEGLVTMMNVKNNISLATIQDCSTVGIINGRQMESKARKYIDQLHIKTHSTNIAVNSLSGGNQQKVVLAKWISASPDILILDEPTRGIDVGAKREIYKLIRQLAENGTAIIVVSSEIPEVIGLADRVYIMREGKMMGDLSSTEINHDMIMHMMFGHIEPAVS